MKAPDKIYIPLYPNHSLDGYHLADDYMYEPQQNCDNVEYIRKDAVLELLQNRNKEIKGEPKAIFRSFELQVLYRRISAL